MSRPAHLSVVAPPRISKLATMGGHYPIPWITPFRPDVDGPMVTATSGPGGAIVDCTCTYGVGEPVFGEPCPTRQRSGMLGMLCNTCGEPVEEDERLFIGAERAGHQWVSHEPPTHPECAAYSALACPILRQDVQKVPVLLGRAHTLLDIVITGFDATGTPARRQLPHGAPRPNYPLYNHVAVFPPAHVRSMTLARWLANEAPRLLPTDA